MTDRIAPWMKEAAELTMEVDENRCAICSWPLAATAKDGCVRGNCSYRPDSEYEKQRLRERRNEIERRAQIIAAHVPQPTAINCSTCQANEEAGLRCAECGRRIGPIEGRKADVYIPLDDYQDGSTEPSPPNGMWPNPCLQRAFVDGAAWWQLHKNGSTMFPAERGEAEAAALAKFGEPEVNVRRPTA